MRDLRALLLALTFLTTLPFPQPRGLEDGDFARASAFYPLAGWVVGGVVALLLWLPLPLPGGVRAALALGAWLAVTGLLHFDGLVDSADALFVMKSPERRLEIMKDVHVGAFGLATGGLVLLTLWSLLGGALPLFAPVAAAVVARTLLLLPMNTYPAARPGSLGAQSRAATQSRQGHWMIAVLLALPTLLFPGAWLAWLVGLVTVLVTARFAASRLGGGLTGDSYGFIITITEIAVLCAHAWGRHA